MFELIKIIKNILFAVFDRILKLIVIMLSSSFDFLNKIIPVILILKSIKPVSISCLKTTMF